MGQETEIKLRINDVEALRRALKKMGAKKPARGASRVHEFNVLFDTPEGELRKREELLRLRTETPEGRAGKKEQKEKEGKVTFKRRPSQDGSEQQGEEAHKVREEIELEVSDSEAFTRILEGMGMRGWFRYEKYRTKFGLPGSQRWAKELVIDLDETPIGTFVELEGPAEAIDRAAEKLGYSKRDYITEDYLELYREECRKRGTQPGYMVFAKRKAASAG
jgi:adenylate cyclase class 2